jgi:hypothetical protein
MQFAAQRLFALDSAERLAAANAWARRPCHMKELHARKFRTKARNIFIPTSSAASVKS